MLKLVSTKAKSWKPSTLHAKRAAVPSHHLTAKLTNKVLVPKNAFQVDSWTKHDSLQFDLRMRSKGACYD